MSKKRILCFFDYFYPAYKSGGPARSSLGLVENLSPFFDFKVITRDRDKEDQHSFVHAVINQWFDFLPGVKVFYLSPNKWIVNMVRAVQTSEMDLYYFNSFYSPKFTILPLLLIMCRILPKNTVIIAPRGEFSPNAMKIKSFKKTVYRFLFKILFRDVKFHATASHEVEHIKNVLSWAHVDYAPNLRSVKELEQVSYCPSSKVPGKLRLLFLSRISPMKNLEYALQILSQCRCEIQFSIFGPVDDPGYWSSCQKQMENIPGNIKVGYKGPVSQKDVISTIQAHDLLFLPTRGENFGHIVLESLIASRPVLISNNTPWNHLNEQQAGWSFDLSSSGDFVSLLDKLTLLNNSDFEDFARRAYDYGQHVIGNQDCTIALYKQLFS